MISQRQLRDTLRTARRDQDLDDKPNVVARALRYADILGQHPELTKTELAAELGISRIRLYQTLNVLKLPHPILEFISTNDSPEYRTLFTERRLRPLTQITDEVEQTKLFGHMLRQIGPRS
jgi:hypothetical protein